MATIVSPASIMQAAEFVTRLQRGGVEAQEVQRVIDDVALRNEVIRAIKGGSDEPLFVDINVPFNQAAMDAFVKKVFSHYFNDAAQAERVGWTLLPGITPQQLAVTEIIKVLFEGLDQFHVAVAVLRGGLVTGTEMSATEVAERLEVSTHTVAKARSMVRQHVIARQKTIYPFAHFVPSHDVAVEGADLSTLELSVRCFNVLQRNGIKTVEALEAKSSSDLLDLPGFGDTTLSEVVKRLSMLQRSLRDA